LSSPSRKYEFSDDEFERAAAGEEPIRGLVISANRGLAVKAAEKWARRNPEMHIDDLIQAGSVGLIRAVDKFDPHRGYKFSTYAMHWIVKEIRLEVASSISVGRATKTEAQLFMAGRLPDERRGAYRAATGEHQCIDEPGRGEERSLAETLCDHEWDGHDLAETRANIEIVMDGALCACTPEQFEAIGLRFGVMFCDEPCSYEAIADELDLGSATQAKALVDEALAEIRRRLGE
jgi:RNA polymerase sigma factor (sigma-70 family)